MRSFRLTLGFGSPGTGRKQLNTTLSSSMQSSSKSEILSTMQSIAVIFTTRFNGSLNSQHSALMLHHTRQRKGPCATLTWCSGVGKTATAEAVAQKWGKPLFPITCGDLGLTPESVEKSVNGIFCLAHLWDCVLLLDEADVFISRRTHGSDLQRNALVSGKSRAVWEYMDARYLRLTQFKSKCFSVCWNITTGSCS